MAQVAAPYQKRLYVEQIGMGYRRYRLRVAYRDYPAGTRVYVRPSLCVAYEYWLWFSPDRFIWESALKNFDALFIPDNEGDAHV